MYTHLGAALPMLLCPSPTLLPWVARGSEPCLCLQERYRLDCNLAVQLLKCNKSHFRNHKFADVSRASSCQCPSSLFRTPPTLVSLPPPILPPSAPPLCFAFPSPPCLLSSPSALPAGVLHAVKGQGLALFIFLE